MAALARVGLLRQTGRMHFKSILNILRQCTCSTSINFGTRFCVIKFLNFCVWFPLVFSRKCHNNTSIITLSLLFSLFQFHLHLT